MSNYFIGELCNKNRSMLNLEKGLNLYHLLRQTLLLGIPGEVVELGSYRGLTAILMQKTLLSADSSKTLHIFDSFQGLPSKNPEDILDRSFPTRPCDIQDNQRVNGGWFASARSCLEQNFHHYNVPLPVIHEGWFADTLHELPANIAFAHLDGDFYSSTLEGLQFLYPKLSPGAIVVIDDYCDPKLSPKQNSLPGVKRACDHFFQKRPEEIQILAAGREYQAYFTKSRCQARSAMATVCTPSKTPSS